MQCASIYGESTGEERYVLTCFLPFNNPSRTSFLTCFNYQYQGVWSAAFSPNGQYFAFVDSGGFVSLHEGERQCRWATHVGCTDTTAREATLPRRMPHQAAGAAPGPAHGEAHAVGDGAGLTQRRAILGDNERARGAVHVYAQHVARRGLEAGRLVGLLELGIVGPAARGRHPQRVRASDRG